MIIFDAVVASDRDHVLTEGDDERHAIHIVDLSEPPNVPISQPRIRREEAEVFRLRGNPFIEGDKSVCIGGPDRAQMGNPAVGQQYVGLPFPRVSGRVRIKISRGLTHGHGQSLIRTGGPAGLVFRPWPTS